MGDDDHPAMATRLPDYIETARLVLRLWAEEDAAALGAAIEASAEHLRPWMAWMAYEPKAPDARAEKIRQWRADWEQGGDVVLGVILDGNPIGGTGLHRRLGPDALEIGYWIHAHHTRQGYATELSAALTDAAFGLDGIERVEIHHDKANVASRRVPEKLGFTLAGESLRESDAPAAIGIELRWVMTRAEWSDRALP
jgi:RimJ/RimL family protein N-acetyltransferase